MCGLALWTTGESKLSSSQNGVSPSCVAGTDTKLTVSGVCDCCICGFCVPPPPSSALSVVASSTFEGGPVPLVLMAETR